MATVTIKSITRQVILNGNAALNIRASVSGGSVSGRFRAEINTGGVTWSTSERQDGVFTFVPGLKLLTGFPDAQKANARVTVAYYENGKLTGSATTTIELIADGNICGPEIGAGWIDCQAHNDGTGYPEGVYVRDSRMKVTFNNDSVTTRYGATIADIIVNAGGSTVTANSGVAIVPVNADGFVQCVCTVRDSRGFKATETFAVYAHAYASPTISNVTAFRADADEKPDEKGAYIVVKANANIAELGGSNSVRSFDAKLYLTGSTEVKDSAEMENGVVKLGDGNILPAKSYKVVIYLQDTCNRYETYTVIIPTAAAAFNIKPGGKGAAFGRLAELDNALDIREWDLLTRGILMGNVYMTTTEHDPAVLFGGTWTQNTDTGLPFRVWQREE